MVPPQARGQKPRLLAARVSLIQRKIFKHVRIVDANSAALEEIIRPQTFGQFQLELQSTTRTVLLKLIV